MMTCLISYLCNEPGDTLPWICRTFPLRTGSC